MERRCGKSATTEEADNISADLHEGEPEEAENTVSADLHERDAVPADLPEREGKDRDKESRAEAGKMFNVSARSVSNAPGADYRFTRGLESGRVETGTGYIERHGGGRRVRFPTYLPRRANTAS